LQQYAQAILTDFPFSYKEILYSQYYWFVHYKNQYFSKVGYDGGLDQQAFLLIEHLVNELEGEVDWELIEDIEKSVETKLLKSESANLSLGFPENWFR
jgi:hypothetical protein